MTVLADLTTLRIGGPAARLVEATTADEIVDAVRAADDAGESVLVLGGGSNVVIADEGFDGTVVLVRSRGVEVTVDGCAGAWVAVAAGEVWDDVVARAVDEEWAGVEALSGIPGLAGATPMQNVGAYGAEIGDVLARVTAYDRRTRRVDVIPVGDCGLGYRDSMFKREPGRYVVLAVTMQLPLGELSAPIRYTELARTLGVEVGDRAPAVRVREAVLELRRAKGMVLDANDHDTWSVGSFFTNPIVSVQVADTMPADAPRWPAESAAGDSDSRVKLSAAWLVQHAGFERGFTLDGRAGLSTKHTLALTNRGGASAADLMGLADHIRRGVHDRFGIDLVPEPTVLL